MEAQSQRLACIATDVSGIPELIEHQVTGLLAPPNDPVALSRNIAELICDPVRRAALASAGERRVRSRFAMDCGIDALARRFGLTPSDPQIPDLSDPSLARHEAILLDAD